MGQIWRHALDPTFTRKFVKILLVPIGTVEDTRPLGACLTFKVPFVVFHVVLAKLTDFVQAPL